MKPSGYAVLTLASIVALPWLLRLCFPTLAWIVPVAINLALCALFAVTLRAGSEPMIARFARAERGGVLEPDLVRYTRSLTWTWVAYFAVVAGVCALLWIDGDRQAWLVFTSVGSYGGAALLFVGEYWYRRHRFAQYAHATPWVLWSHVMAVLRARGRQ